jgi:putative RNA 2'-phosphotransferase
MSGKNKNDDVSLGKFISLILRHKPETIGITLDSEGWADVDELINGINAAGYSIDMETLERIVAENNKKRYTLSPDKKRIRANQGHSIDVQIDMEKREPPALLYHGTATRFLDSIKAEGIKKMSRQYVHLSPDIHTAAAVGKRHGAPAVLVIDAAKMHADGFEFRISANGVW